MWQQHSRIWRVLQERKQAVLVDADVDASNLELLLEAAPLEAHDFMGGQVAVIDPRVCSGCGLCVEACRFNAMGTADEVAIDPLACEGCGACLTQCPNGAIHLEVRMAGRWFKSATPYGMLFHAALRPGAENSGKLVTLIKQEAALWARSQNRPLVIVDGPPGIGCPVIAAVSGADLAVLVTEPTVSGVQDMERVLATVRHFEVPALVCINKADIYPKGCRQIEAICCDNHLPVVAHVPFDMTMTETMVQGQPITRYRPTGDVSDALRRAWQGVIDVLDRVGEVT